MRSLGAAIIILGSCVCFSAAAFITHNDTNLFLNGVAVVVGVVGFAGWWSPSANENHPT